MSESQITHVQCDALVSLQAAVEQDSLRITSEANEFRHEMQRKVS